jgi:cold shock CspA family protein
MEGRVKFFHRDRFFGFIQLEDETGERLGVEYDFFFFGGAVLGAEMPEKGELVDFWLADSQRDGEPWRAVQVRRRTGKGFEQEQLDSESVGV